MVFVSVTIQHRSAEDGIVYRITGKCFHSMRKNEAPHSLVCDILVSSAETCICNGTCSCTIGDSGCCGHLIGLLFQVAEYSTLKLSAVPDPVPSTSLPQEWHKPRGKKIGAARVEDITLSSPAGVTKSRAVSSTLYNPLEGCAKPDFQTFRLQLEQMTSSCQWLTMESDSASLAQTKFGDVPRGCVLSYQQVQDPLNICNVPGVEFPPLPVADFTAPMMRVISESQTRKLERLMVTYEQSVAFEKDTRLQTESALWHQLRQSRITASKVGQVCIRRSAHDKLCDQLRRKFRATAAMKEGSLREPEAAVAYANIMNDDVNLYACGLVISPYSYWIAASPDRKVYCPTRQPPFGLLEIKCPQAQVIQDVKCLESVATSDGSVYRLKRSDIYYYQVMCQLAVTGLTWCDFFIYLENSTCHLETIDFDPVFWCAAQGKVDSFFFGYFLE